MLQRIGRAAPACLAALAIWIASARAFAMSCTILNASSVRFGSYNPFYTVPLDSAGTVSFRCTSVATADMLSIELGRGTSNSYLPRAMMNRSTRLEYNLFLDAARTIVWGDGTSGTSTYTAHPAEGQAVSVPIYARIPPRQNAEPGTYGDFVVLTILY
jgi:spore coat protein U-like protein